MVQYATSRQSNMQPAQISWSPIAWNSLNLHDLACNKNKMILIRFFFISYKASRLTKATHISCTLIQSHSHEVTEGKMMSLFSLRHLVYCIFDLLLEFLVPEIPEEDFQRSLLQTLTKNPEKMLAWEETPGEHTCKPGCGFFHWSFTTDDLLKKKWQWGCSCSTNALRWEWKSECVWWGWIFSAPSVTSEACL